jgi:hypothetical protein
MLKLIGYLVVFVIGAGAGVWWGVGHPSAAADLANTEQLKISEAVALARQNLLQQFVGDQQTATTQPETVPSHLSKWKDLLDKASQDVKDASHKAMNQ